MNCCLKHVSYSPNSITWSASDRSLRRHLSRLVELEYVLAYRTGRGNQREYQLLYDPHARLRTGWQLGLVDVDRLRQETRSARPTRQARAAPQVE